MGAQPQNEARWYEDVLYFIIKLQYRYSTGVFVSYRNIKLALFKKPPAERHNNPYIFVIMNENDIYNLNKCRFLISVDRYAIMECIVKGLDIKLYQFELERLAELTAVRCLIKLGRKKEIKADIYRRYDFRY